MKLRLGTALPIALLAALSVTGCGAGNVVDDEKTAIAIQFDIQDATGVKVKSASCPADVPVEIGRTFECEVVTRSGDRAVATLEITSDKADLRVVSLKKS
ncbi:MAG: DUF4333 domain-containing protein [Solirubrobacterales bacterium]|nr:DUF4333 domain-containing protein [Solirubrobacterales bacterium]